MSTDYQLTEATDDNDKELILTESSAKVTLGMFEGEQEVYHALVRDMDAKELVRMALVLMRVASYLDGDLTEAMKDQEEYAVSELKRVL